MLALLAPVWLFSQTDTLAATAAQAQRALQAQDFAKAEQLYSELVKALPSNPGLRMNLGLARFSAGKYELAADDLRRASKAGPKLWPARLMLGLSLQKLGRPAEAIAPLESVLTERPGDEVARFELADALLATGQAGKAAAHFRQLTETRPDHTKAWYGLLLAHEEMARDAGVRVAANTGRPAYAAALQARERARGQQYVSAVRLYREALALGAIPGLHDEIASIYRATGHPDWAAIETGRERTLPRPDCLKQAQACAYLAGNFAVLAAAPPGSSPEVLYWQALAHDELARQARLKLERLPPSPELYQVRAKELEERTRYADAAREWREAAALTKSDPRVQRGLARALWLARDYDAAIPLLRELAAAGSSEARYLLGDSLLERDGPEAALADLETALKFDPASPQIRASLGKTYMRSGQAAKAIPFLEAGRGADTDGSVHFQLSRALRATGGAEAAQAPLARYQEIRRELQAANEERNQQTSVPPP
jgi:tetratricopeptide (TPR) repeat protein